MSDTDRSDGAIWYIDGDGIPQPTCPSNFIWEDMDTDAAKDMLGRLVDLLWEKGIISGKEVVEEILCLPGSDGI